MKFSISLAALLASGAWAVALSARAGEDQIPNGVIAVDIQHKREVGRLGKRDASNDIYGSYVIVFGVGTPTQQQSAIVDTGSSDLWINGPWSGQTPFYNPAKSTSYQYDSDGFYIAYGSGDASGYWISEDVNIAGSTLKNQQMGLVNNPSAGQAVFGIGMMTNEVANTQYNNVPQNLYVQNLIKANAYSIYLDNLETSTGRILFGGIDSSKYNGTLYSVPITDNVSFYVDVNEITVGGKTVTNNGKFSGLMDSGTTFCYLPSSIAKNVAQEFNAQFDPSTGLYFAQTNTSSKEFVFNFSGATIKVPASEMLVDASYIMQGSSPGPYVLGVVPSDEAPYIIGDTFLRSAYVVFDVSTMHIAIGQASYDANANISAITKGGIQGAVPAPGYNANQAVRTILTVAIPGSTGLGANDVEANKASSPSVAAASTASTSPSTFQWPWWWPFKTAN
ncbi:Yps3p [Sugiyamaella lignohabitans]|uniref:Yps3p n=1 Tax=Sugiyamaella lignohabitans TaxID=796027 RepID=A0A167D8A1_9ASCO|nr:Yps3p [Sugiyamaella lignohabitans]ANB12602.1 Yps3p [Sugiyamaella lignohabitans]